MKEILWNEEKQGFFDRDGNEYTEPEARRQLYIDTSSNEEIAAQNIKYERYSISQTVGKEDFMKFCSKCGAEVNDDAVICVKCGCQIAPTNNTNTNDKPSGGFAFLGFLIPVVGLVLYLVWNQTTPLKAKSCGKGALIGFIVSVVFWIIYGIVIGRAVTAYF
jgi:hypothetical protein